MIFKLGLTNMPAGVLQEENMNQHVVSCLYLLKTPCEGRGGKGWFLLSVHECVHACGCVGVCAHAHMFLTGNLTQGLVHATQALYT